MPKQSLTIDMLLDTIVGQAAAVTCNPRLADILLIIVARGMECITRPSYRCTHGAREKAVDTVVKPTALTRQWCTTVQLYVSYDEAWLRVEHDRRR